MIINKPKKGLVEVKIKSFPLRDVNDAWNESFELQIVQMSGPITTTAPQPQQQPQQTIQQQQQQQTPRAKESGTPSISGVRRRSGPTQGLRSPAAKRPVSAPVALQGWLHKQGSEGLMLWKKRWFVLSEYCLFYYKGWYLTFEYRQYFNGTMTVWVFYKKKKVFRLSISARFSIAHSSSDS